MLEEAQRKLDDLDLAMAVQWGLVLPIAAGANEPTRCLPLEEGKSEYLKHVSRPRSMKGATQNTRKRYGAVFGKAIPYFEQLGIHTWNEVDQSVLEGYATFLQKQGYAHATQGLEITTLKQALNFLVDRGLVTSVERFNIEIDKVTETTTYCYKVAEVEAMVEHCQLSAELHWLQDVIIALSSTGMRIGELAQLRWSSVDLVKNTITVVDETRSSVMATANARSTKSGKSRVIPIQSDFGAVLERLSQKSKGGTVFRAARGGQLRPRNVLHEFVTKVIEPMAKQFPSDDGEQGFESGRLHSFRHYFCSSCARCNIPEVTVQAWLGHSSSKITRRYFHLDSHEAQTQMSKLTVRSA